MPYVSACQAIDLLNRDHVVAIPTETVYGLAGRVESEAALKKIFEVKDRPFFDPLIVHVTDWDQATEFFTPLHPLYKDLAETFWPGPLTLVAPRKKNVNDLITSGQETVAIRAPRHPLAQEILKKTGPLAAPSANRFGKTSPTSAAHVLSEFPNEVGVVDGGICEVGLESTVIRILDSSLMILRPGRILAEDLAAMADKYGLHLEMAPSSASPGHLKHHYQPDVPLVLLKNPRTNAEIEDFLQTRLAKKFKIQRIFLPSDVRTAARNLYGEMRKLASDQNNVIVADLQSFKWQSDSTDLMDRLERAATYTF